MTTKRVHKLKADAFFDILRENRDGLVTMSFDCQKNMAVPKLPDSAAYFSSQINFYNFTIVIGDSKTTLRKENVFSYCWSEHERPKGSNEIASALFHRLRCTDLTNIDTVRLIADGCGGQNKNKIVMCMLMKWLQSENSGSVQNVEVIFPVVGHSFIPPDRVFAQVEKALRKKSTIVTPKEYMKVIADFATVYNFIDDGIILYDFKEVADEILKLPGSWHFKFNRAKRFFLKKNKKNVSVQGEESYRCITGEPKFVTKKGASLSSISPACLNTGVKIKDTKIKSIENLLKKHYGEKWATEFKDELDLFIRIRNANAESAIIIDDEETCGPMPNDDLQV